MDSSAGGIYVRFFPAGRLIRGPPQSPTKGYLWHRQSWTRKRCGDLPTNCNRFNTDLENRLVLLQARFTSLGDTWQDQEHEKFAEEFRTAMKALKKFVELSKAHTPYLLRKAQRIEEYLHQR